MNRTRLPLALALAVVALAVAAPGAGHGIAPGKLVLQSNATGNFDIYTIDSDGTERVDVTNDPALDIVPGWSPTKDRIAFSSRRLGTRDPHARLRQQPRSPPDWWR